MGRRSRSTEHEGGGGGGHDGGGALRWLLTYADMITLLMAFFIMLYSMSILDLNKFRQVAISIRSGFGGLEHGQGRSILGTSGQFSVRPSPMIGDSVGVPWQTIKSMQKLVKKEGLEQTVTLRADERGLIVSIATDKVLFARGSAELSPDAKHIISVVAKLLKDLPNHVRIEGHTCDLPIRSGKFPSNWELSALRATTVVRYLIEQLGFSPERLSAAGYADTRSLVPNTNERNRAINRRVDIVILRTDESEPGGIETNADH
ncbi:MAG: OmpA/MotB family protein [Armatimonadota bacterium]